MNAGTSNLSQSPKVPAWSRLLFYAAVFGYLLLMSLPIIHWIIGPLKQTFMERCYLPVFWAMQLIFSGSFVLVYQPKQKHKRRWLLLGAIFLGWVTVVWAIGGAMVHAW
jgi:hypothetical protein